jgi:hypothetical protein
MQHVHDIEFLMQIGCTFKFAKKFLKAIHYNDTFIYGRMALNDYEILEIQEYTINKNCSVRKAFEDLQGIILSPRKTLLDLGKEYLELETFLEQLAYVKNNNIKNRIFLKWIGEVNLSDSHRNTKRTKEQHLKFLEVMINKNTKN